MQIQSTRANELNAYLIDRSPETNLFVRLELDGQFRVLQVFSIPIDKLTFNIRNGRFAAELRAREKALGRKLDSYAKDDAAIIQKLLLDQNEAETVVLKEDLRKHGQVEPGIITHDGAVINGNRRMAIISALSDVTKESKWEYLKVAILPPTVGDKDLWRIEAGLQFAKDFRLEYGPINELLKLREGIRCGLDAGDISATLLGRYTDKEVEARLRVLELIENYLDAIGKPGDFAWIGKERLMEKFNSLSDNVIESLKSKSELDEIELHRLSQAGFALIAKTDRTHWNIRQLAPIARNSDARQTFLDALPDDPLQANADVLNEAFSSAEDLVEGQKERDKPDRLLHRALSAVKSIDRNNKKLRSPETQALVKQLIEACGTLLAEKNGR